jgi:hypothetical protein
MSSSAPVINRSDRLAWLPVHLLLIFVALAAAVVSQGGYYPPARTLVTVLVVLAFVVTLAVHPSSWRHAGPLLVSSAALGLWAVVRAGANGTPLSGLPVVATLACVVATVLVVTQADVAQRELCVAVALGVGVLVAVTGWIGVAWRVPAFAWDADERLWRATSTLTYANAAAALLAPLSVLAVALLVGQTRSPVRAVMAYLLLVGLGATLSRAGALAGLTGLLVLAAFAGVRATARAAVPLVAAAAIAVAGLAASFPVTADPQPLLATAALAAGLLVALGAGRLSGRVQAVALVVVVAGVGAVIAARVSLARGLDILADSRATLGSPTRTGSAEAAWRLVAGQPLAGVGPGRASFTWSLPDGRVVTGRYAHNEYLQVLVELGGLGLVLLLGVLAAIVLIVWRGRPVAPSRLLWAGAAAGLVALLVHSGFDFLWQIPVIPLAGGLLAGLAGPTVHSGSGTAAREDP